MRDYARIVTKIRETPWLMTPQALDAMLHMVDERLKNGKLSDEELITRLNDTERSMLFHDGDHDNGNGNSIVGGIGVLPIMGPIFGRSNMMTEMSGATSLETFSNQFKKMLSDDGISSIILDVDSPGGSSDMIHETGELIKSARGTKPVYAIANGMAGSAAYWLASQAEKLYVSPSGSVGSIGVYTVHEDQSAKDALEGKRFTFISAGEHKTEGNPHEALSEESKEFYQDRVDGLYDDFLNVVAEGRGVSAKRVKQDYGKGRMLRPAEALEIGMVDGVRSFDQLVSDIASQPQKVKVVIDGKQMANAVAAHKLTSGSVTASKLASNPATGGTFMLPQLSQTTDVGWLPAIQTSDGTVWLESKEWEHSEPGTGSPPQPREDEDGSDDIAIVQGWRRSTPPIAEDPPQASVIKSSRGGFVMDDEFVLSGRDARALLSALNLSEDTEPAKIVEALKIQFGELEALRNSVSAAEQERIFAETYPQYWEEHRKLMERDREHTAANFIASVQTIRKTEGYGLKSTKQQLSVEAQNILMATHKKFGEGQGNLEDFEAAIKAVVNGGIVQLGEIGNSEGAEIPEFDTSSAGGLAGARKLFAEQVTKVQAENPNMTYQEALAETGKKHPDLAESYRLTLPA